MTKTTKIAIAAAAIAAAVTASADQRVYEKQFGDFKFHTVEISTGRGNAG
jgi:hypothetical protein